jgi:murein DD-endopeptidase MepM/ murein hydrolase activator NlpD
LAAVVICCLSAGATSSIAASNGGSGNAIVAPPPRLLDGRCVATTQHPCENKRVAEAGGSILLRGRGLGAVTSVVFYGKRGPADDVSSPVTERRANAVRATVPQGAYDGPVAVETGSGVRSRRWLGLMISDSASVPSLPRLNGAEPAIGTAVSAPQKVFYGGLKKAVFAYQVGGNRSLDVDVSVVRVPDGSVVRTWQAPQAAPGVTAKIVWDGTANGKVQPEGRYAFRAATDSAAAMASASGPGDGSFAFYDHMFPVRGHHDFGNSGARFGAGRTGHIHQGQDVFARCGTPMVAARAGKVEYKGYHSLAGYYLVISGSDTGQDYLYAHLRAPALVKKGDRVYTGQPIGEVGDTGNAVGCHLHFELWSAPGWYKGGKPFDPLSELQRWDRAS